MRLLDRIINDSIPIWDECIETPFIQEFIRGTLDEKKLNKYMTEDSVYLLEYAKCFAYALIHCKTFEEMRFIYSILGFTNEAETSVRREYIKNHGWSDYDVETMIPDPICKEYIDHMMYWCKNGTLLDGIISLLPCMLSYQYIFNKAKNINPDILNSKYAYILKYYVCEEYQADANIWINFAEKLCVDLTKEDEDRLLNIFRKSSILELEFWKMSYEKTNKFSI